MNSGSDQTKTLGKAQHIEGDEESLIGFILKNEEFAHPNVINMVINRNN